MTETTLEDEGLRPHRSLWRDVWVQFRAHRGAMAGAIVLAVIVLMVVIGPMIHTLDPTYSYLQCRNSGPSLLANERTGLVHPLGCDNIGRTCSRSFWRVVGSRWRWVCRQC